MTHLMAACTCKLWKKTRTHQKVGLIKILNTITFHVFWKILLDATVVISANSCDKAHKLDKILASRSTVHLGLTGQ